MSRRIKIRYTIDEITNDFLGLSSNHFYTFFIISLIGLFSFKDLKKIINYLILLSIFLELSHIIIPNRSFQFSDLFGNVFGIIVSVILIRVFKYWRN